MLALNYEQDDLEILISYEERIIFHKTVNIMQILQSGDK